MLVAIVAVSIPITRWLSADTIFHADSSFTIHFPDGSVIVTNRWFKKASDFEYRLLMTDRAHEFKIKQPHVDSDVAAVYRDGKKYAVLLTDYKIRGPSYRGEFWVEIGEEIKIPANEAQTE